MDAGPIRTCVGCRSKRPQSQMARLSRSSDGAVSSGAGAPGRGAYLCRDAACFETAFTTGRLRRALRSERLEESLLQDLMRKELDGEAKGPRGSEGAGP
ncbi:MAG: YlxR family protein [Actinomycetota bacterium]